MPIANQHPTTLKIQLLYLYPALTQLSNTSESLHWVVCPHSHSKPITLYNHFIGLCNLPVVWTQSKWKPKRKLSFVPHRAKQVSLFANQMFIWTPNLRISILSNRPSLVGNNAFMDSINSQPSHFFWIELLLLWVLLYDPCWGHCMVLWSP